MWCYARSQGDREGRPGLAGMFMQIVRHNSKDILCSVSYITFPLLQLTSHKRLSI
jgi:hypothetical protein